MLESHGKSAFLRVIHRRVQNGTRSQRCNDTVAARLEGIAQPGGISISEDAWRQVQGKVTANFVDTGEQRLKNIPRPVRVYCLKQARARIAWMQEGMCDPRPLTDRRQATLYEAIAAIRHAVLDGGDKPGRASTGSEPEAARRLLQSTLSGRHAVFLKADARARRLRHPAG